MPGMREGTAARALDPHKIDLLAKRQMTLRFAYQTGPTAGAAVKPVFAQDAARAANAPVVTCAAYCANVRSNLNIGSLGNLR